MYMYTDSGLINLTFVWDFVWDNNHSNKFVGTVGNVHTQYIHPLTDLAYRGLVNWHVHIRVFSTSTANYK